ncbi:CBO0543 family protein [Niallia taxi]|uniref:CBO0543 family protein n=1 Tax=Niallia taxi TaxID=2499688 RepID=UPI003D2BB831
MKTEQAQQLKQIIKEQDQVVEMWLNYWREYSNWEDWHFWFIVLMLIVPLIIVYFSIDKKRAFHIGFFGFNIHVWFTYSDALATRTAHVIYPYQAIPILPVNFALDASLVPVAFMLLYQWCLKNDKSILIYGIILSAILSFIFKPLLNFLNLIQLDKGMNFFYLFLNYILILLFAIGITFIFKHLNQKAKKL